MMTVERYHDGRITDFLEISVLTEAPYLWNFISFFDVPPSTAKWAFSRLYFAIFSSKTAYIYKFDGAKHHSFLNITINGTVYSIAINNEFLVVSVNSTIRKYWLSTGKLLAVLPTPNN